MEHFDLSVEVSIKDNIDELTYEATDTVRGKMHKIPNKFSISNYLNANTDRQKDVIQKRIRYILVNGKLESKSLNGINFYFKFYSTDPAVLNDSDLFNKIKWKHWKWPYLNSV